MAQDLNRRFLTCMREIEAGVLDNSASNFKDAVYDLVPNGTLSAAQAQDLDWMWELRNLLTHHDIDGSDVALVQHGTVRAAERIRNNLSDHVPSVSGMLSDVAMARPSDSVAATAKTMAREDYSCLPIKIQNQVVGAVDADMILQWVAHDLEDAGLLEDITVGELRDQAPGPRLEFMRGDCAQREVAKAFTDSLDEQGPLAAVLLTSDGSESGLVKGIVTPWDVPSLHT